ncbi:retrovirus-related Pol polyprotein from transposon RE1 [Trichonephila clavipes]|nr:retrovirus-related Pol polyprotein from transposon RE1 [Trichonephila clavipes]
MMGYAQRTKGYRIWLIDENKLVETINVRFDENKRGINFRQKVNSNLGYNLNLPDYYDDEDDFDRVKDSLASRLVSKTSTETPSTSEKPDVSSDNHSLIPCTEVKWIRNIGRKVTGSNVYYSIEGEATRLKSFNEIERYCKRHNIEYDPSLFNFRKNNTESQGFSDLSEQQEALMVEVTIPNCYKQAIRSRDASKWHDAMDKEINVMKERKVWDLVDHPDNIKILENRWVYTIKYDENNKIVKYKARLVARGNTQLRGESFDEVFSPVINFTITVLEAKREEFVDDALIYAKSLCEELEISFESPRQIRRKHIFGNGSKNVQLSYEDDLRRTMFSLIDRVTTEIRERFQQL